MITDASLTLTQALRMVPGSLPYSLPLPWIARHLGPRQKSYAWCLPTDGHRIGPTTFGGTAVIGEATDGDGDENSSRDKRHM